MNSAILAGAYAKAIESIRSLLSPSYQKEIETYLSESVDLVDLERRLKLLQLRGFVI